MVKKGNSLLFGLYSHGCIVLLNLLSSISDLLRNDFGLLSHFDTGCFKHVSQKKRCAQIKFPIAAPMRTRGMLVL